MFQSTCIGYTSYCFGVIKFQTTNFRIHCDLTHFHFKNVHLCQLTINTVTMETCCPIVFQMVLVTMHTISQNYPWYCCFRHNIKTGKLSSIFAFLYINFIRVGVNRRFYGHWHQKETTWNPDTWTMWSSYMASLATENYTTHWGRDKMATILRTPYSKGIFWMEIYELRLRFDLFLEVQITIYYSIGSGNGLALTRRKAIIWTNDGLVCWRIYASLDLRGYLNIKQIC